MRMYGNIQNRIITEYKLTPEAINDIKTFERKWKTKKS